MFLVLLLQQTQIPLEFASALGGILVTVVLNHHIRQPLNCSQVAEGWRHPFVNSALPAELRMSAKESRMVQHRG